VSIADPRRRASVWTDDELYKEEEIVKKLLIVTLVVCLSGSVALFGCASIVGKGGPQNLSLRSAPDQADFEVYDETGAKVTTGKTPAVVSLEKKKGYFSGKKYTIKMAKANCVPKSQVVDTEVNLWYVGGNLIFGGLIGYLVVDPATGAMWSLDTKEVNMTLDPEQQAPEQQKSMGQESMKVSIMQLQDVPAPYRHSMVKISE
jgi:hypothetical protein